MTKKERQYSSFCGDANMRFANRGFLIDISYFIYEEYDADTMILIFNVDGFLHCSHPNGKSFPSNFFIKTSDKKIMEWLKELFSDLSLKYNINLDEIMIENMKVRI